MRNALNEKIVIDMFLCLPFIRCLRPSTVSRCAFVQKIQIKTSHRLCDSFSCEYFDIITADATQPNFDNRSRPAWSLSAVLCLHFSYRTNVFALATPWYTGNLSYVARMRWLFGSIIKLMRYSSVVWAEQNVKNWNELMWLCVVQSFINKT